MDYKSVNISAFLPLFLFNPYAGFDKRTSKLIHFIFRYVKPAQRKDLYKVLKFPIYQALTACGDPRKYLISYFFKVHEI